MLLTRVINLIIKVLRRFDVDFSQYDYLKKQNTHLLHSLFSWSQQSRSYQWRFQDWAIRGKVIRCISGPHYCERKAWWSQKTRSRGQIRTNVTVNRTRNGQPRIRTKFKRVKISWSNIRGYRCDLRKYDRSFHSIMNTYFTALYLYSNKRWRTESTCWCVAGGTSTLIRGKLRIQGFVGGIHIRF